MAYRMVVVAVALVAATAAIATALARAQEAPPSDPAEAKRLEIIREIGCKATVTIYPVHVLGIPDRNVADALGLVLEKSGAAALDSSVGEFVRPAEAAWDQIPALFGAFVAKNPPASDYAMYAEFLGDPKSGPTEVRFVIVNAKGELVIRDVQTPNDADFKRTAARDPDPMGCSVLVAERVFSRLHWKKSAAKEEGRFARLWAQKSGTPTAAERKEIETRLGALRKQLKTAQLTVFNTRIGSSSNNESAPRLAQFITRQTGLNAAVANEAIDTPIQPTSNEQRRLWDLARALRDRLRQSAIKTDYALLAEYAVDEAAADARMVHFVVCTKDGEYVIVDFQNDQSDDFKRIAPKSIADCDKLAAERFAGYLK